MNAIEILEEVRKLPMFTIGDLSRLLRKDEKYVRIVAYRLMKRGLIRQIEKGKYTVHDDAVQFASFIATPSYISFWTALSIYHLTEQIPVDVMVAVPRPKKAIDFYGQRITFTKIRHFWGYTKLRLRDFDIFIAEKEKAVMDCMLAKNVPFDEPAKVILTGELDYEKLIEYAKKTKNAALAKRIGYLIEKKGIDASSLLGMADRAYIPLNWSVKKEGRKDFRWKLIINASLDEL